MRPKGLKRPATTAERYSETEWDFQQLTVSFVGCTAGARTCDVHHPQDKQQLTVKPVPHLETTKAMEHRVGCFSEGWLFGKEKSEQTRPPTRRTYLHTYYRLRETSAVTMTYRVS